MLQVEKRCARCGISDADVLGTCHLTPMDCIRRLRAALPETMDGVPIVPGMELFTCHWAGTREEKVSGLGVHLEQPTVWADGEADEGWLFADKVKCESVRAGADK